MKPHHIAPLLLAAPVLAQTIVFQTDFESGVPPEIQPATARITAVQGFGSLAPGQPGRPTFGGMLLRSETANVVTLSLSGLPAHNALSLDFLFAAIDSLDGTGTFPSGDFFRVSLDGQQIFRESFANAVASQIQSYVEQPGGTLARRQHLGFTFGSFYTDSAYDMGIDPHFRNLPHTASTATVVFVVEGAGVQQLSDESWGMDELTVTVDTVANLASSTPYGAGCGAAPLTLLSSRPVVGATLTTTIDNIPAGASFGVLLLSGTQYSAGVAAPLGPCLQYVGLDDVIYVAPTSTAQLVTLTVPPGIPTGTHVYMQAAIVAGASPSSIVTSNGLDLLVNPN